MKSLSLLLALILALTGVAVAGTYTITTTPGQDAALQALTEQINAARAAQNPPIPAATLQQVVEDQLLEAVRQFTAKYRTELEGALLKAVREKDATKEVEIRKKLGL